MRRMGFLMTDELESIKPAQGWETYWHGTAEAEAFSGGGAGHPALRGYWTRYFRDRAEVSGTGTLLDLCSGNGAVLEAARTAFAAEPPSLHCADASPSAVANIRKRFPDVRGLICDARALPLAPGTFDLVTSQFGVEYAGRPALREAARVLAPGGELALIMHCQGGVIQRECQADLEAVDRLQASRFVPLSIDMFAHGFRALQGADRSPYDAAAARLAPAVTEVERILSEQGAGVAGDTVARLYHDVGRIHSRLPHYEPRQVLAWLTRMDQELDAYIDRMASMIRSALNEDELAAIGQELERSGCKVTTAAALRVPDQAHPLCWIVEANRVE